LSKLRPSKSASSNSIAVENYGALRYSRIMLGVVALVALVPSAQSSTPILLNVDATDTPRNMLRVEETLPVKPGPFLLRYPKWLPGHHSPSGTIANVIELHVSANGKEIPWRRDSVEMFDIHVDVPQGVSQLKVDFIDATQPGRELTSRLGRVKFCELIFLPKGNVEKMDVKAALKTPDGWTAFDALPITQTGNNVDFPIATAERLIDSPAMIGLNGKTFPMSSTVELDVAADEAANLEISDKTQAGLKNLVAEAHALWGAEHYRKYHWLLTLSNYGGFDGLEHNESSEDGSGTDTFTSGKGDEGLVYLLAHEYTHSWNGKYRRPADLYQTDYTTAEGCTLLWVYEGMTEYWGDILSARSGLGSPQHLQDTFARNAASLANKSGRRWRSTEDTAAAASILRSAGAAWGNERRGQDYYAEGTLVWVGADAIIRKQTNDKKSLDDFCKLFFGGHDTGPMIVPYTYEDLVKALNTVAPYDWNAYLQQMVYDVHPAPTTEGLEMAGWKLVYTNEAPPARPSSSGRPGRASGGADHMFDIGISMDGTGTVSDLAVGSPADKAGLAPGTKIIKVGDKDYSSEELVNAINAAMKITDPIVLQVTKEGVTSTVKVDYHEGMKYPHLERIDGTTDYLSEIAAAHVKS
jgi:predicted metalloprotease with PDZ domain